MCNIPGVWWIKLHNSPGLQICCCFGFIVLHLLSSFLFHLNANRCSGVVVFFKCSSDQPALLLLTLKSLLNCYGNWSLTSDSIPYGSVPLLVLLYQCLNRGQNKNKPFKPYRSLVFVQKQLNTDRLTFSRWSTIQ